MTNGTLDDLDNIPIVEKPTGFDASKYEGYKTTIAKVEKLHVRDLYPIGPDGKQFFDPASTKLKWVVEITTEPLKEIDETGKITDKLLEYVDGDGAKKQIVITARFNLQSDKEGNPVISKHPKAKLWQFMKKKGCTKVSELKGKIVLLVAVPSNVEGDERMFLRIVV